jgi:hypothetical protein
MSHEQKISGFGWTMILGVVYLFSPFPVVWAISGVYGGFVNIPDKVGDFVMAFYFPIILASSIWHPITDFYVWGFRLLGVM